MEDLLREIIEENLKFKEEIDILKKQIDSLKREIQEARSDLIVKDALARNR